MEKLTPDSLLEDVRRIKQEHEDRLRYQQQDPCDELVMTIINYGKACERSFSERKESLDKVLTQIASYRDYLLKQVTKNEK